MLRGKKTQQNEVEKQRQARVSNSIFANALCTGLLVVYAVLFSLGIFL
jgi:threonine/homoserine/homoserine lactone efflux protein